MAEEVEIAVVGAGPAGLSAALEARRLGAEVLLIDEGAEPGGQYYMQPHTAAAEVRDSAQLAEGRALLAEARGAGVRLLGGVQVWGFFQPMTLALIGPDGCFEIEPKRLIVATGAHDRSLAFPGWTLPGVMTPGAVQRLIKAEAVGLGPRVVLAGSGPFLLVVARQLLEAGIEIAAYVESARITGSGLFGLARRPTAWNELGGYVRTLLQNRVPLRLGSAVVEARGDKGLESVAIAKLDRRGAPLEGEPKFVETSILAIAHGFRPACELTAIAGCAHGYDDRQGGRFCRVERDTGRTSVEDIFAAGEVTGIAGMRCAREEGRIAGLSAARSLGHWSRGAGWRLRWTRRQRRRAQAFADFVNTSFAPPAGLAGIISDDTLLCRCEDVRAGEVRAAVAAGARTATAVKMWTRCGMGPCQGRICGWSLARTIAQLSGQPLAEIGDNEPRIPIKPLPLGAIVAEEEAAGAAAE